MKPKESSSRRKRLRRLPNIVQMDHNFANRFAAASRPGSEIGFLRERSTEDFAAVLGDMAKGIALEDSRSVQLAENKLAGLVGDSMTLSNMMGRRRLLMELPDKGAQFAEADEALLFADTLSLPKIPFRQAIDYLKSLSPKVARSAKEVSDMYREGKNFSIARTAKRVILNRIKSYIEAGVGGTPREQAIQAIKKAGHFSRGYAKTIYKTNLQSAYTAGRFQQAKEPHIARVVKAFQYVAVNDPPRVRPNHLAHHGLVASQFDSAWNEFAPPQGFNCRCGIRLVTLFEARRRGLLDTQGDITKMTEGEKSRWRGKGAVPDKGFNPTADRVTRA